MVGIDVNRTWAKVDERLAVEDDPVRRRNLEVVLAHMKAAAHGDINGLLDIVADDCAYHAYGAPPESNPVGRVDVRKVYEDLIASGARHLQFDIDRLVVDRDGVLIEGVTRMAYPGRTLAARGVEVDDEDAYCLDEAREAALWPFDEHGMVLGEDAYTGRNGIADRKLSECDILDRAAA
jgi:hypothetical protein